MRRLPLLLCLVLACSGEDSGPFSPGEREDFEEAQARWAARTFDGYTFQVRQSCFCQNSGVWATVQVEGGVITQVTLENDSVIPAGDLDQYSTVERLFALIDILAEESGVVDIAVSFDAQLGYPSFISAESSYQDGGITSEARALVPLP